jgi:molybdopterin-guanine dinucleotide biosynthesis protein B
MSVIISIVGKSNSGKTTLLESLIGELKQRGYNLAVVKHSVPDFDLDRPGKDSWRFAKAGSDTVVLSSPQKMALIKKLDRETTLDDLLYLLGEDFDLVLTEGFKSSHAPKIEVHRSGLGGLVGSPEELFALVTDEPLDVAVPQYSPSEVKALVDLIEKRFFPQGKVEETLLFINGTSIPLNLFVKNIIHNTLLGMVSALKGVEEVKNIRVSLRR